jgi:DNA adenine methylase
MKPLRPPFSRVGGKSKLADKIISVMPPHDTYVECFLGAGAIFFKKPLASKNVINDLDKNIYDLMRDLAVVDKIDYEFSPDTNATRENFVKLLAQTEIQEPAERLYRNLFLNKNSFCANMIKMGYKNPASWKVSKMLYLKNHLKEYQARLNQAEIKNENYKDIIEKYDGEGVLFYLDPPYSRNHKYWNYGLPFITNKDIAVELKKIKGKFIMSYDDTEENEEVFKDFTITKLETIYAVKSKGNKKVKEIIITNFPLPLPLPPLPA